MGITDNDHQIADMPLAGRSRVPTANFMPLATVQLLFPAENASQTTSNMTLEAATT